MNLNVDDILAWVGGLLGVGTVGRFAITALKKQNLGDAALDAHSTALKNALEDAAKWQKRYDDCSAEHSHTLILIGELRVQNKMLRMILIQRGMTGPEIDAALEIHDEND